MPKLTTRLLASLEPRDRPYEVVDSGPGYVPGFKVRVNPGGGRMFYVRYRIDGKPCNHKLGSPDDLPLVRARELAASIRAQAREHEAGRAESPLPKEKALEMPTLGAWIDTYAAAVLAHKKSGQATLERLRKCFPGFMDMQLDDSDMLKRVMLWRDERLHAGKSPVTVNRDISCLSACLSEAVDRGELEAHPLARLKPLKEAREIRVRFLSPDEEERLYAALDAREARIRESRDSANLWREERGYAQMVDLHAAPFVDFVKPLVLLLLHSGLRRGEALGLKWTDIDFEQPILTVRAQGSKTGKPRHVPMNSVLVEALKKWASMGTREGLVFASPKGGGTLTHFRRSWAALMKSANIEAFRVHDTRHHFASRLVQDGEPLNTVRVLLGHASLQMTMRYAHLAPEHGLAAVERLVAPRGSIVPFPGRSREGK